MEPRSTVVYDGNCGVCTALKDAAERRDRGRRLRFVPFLSSNLEEVAPGITHEMASESVYLVQPDGRRFKGAKAFFEAMRRLPNAWGCIGAIGALPPLSLLAEPFYRLAARNRSTISHWLNLDACQLDNGSRAG